MNLKKGLILTLMLTFIFSIIMLLISFIDDTKIVNNIDKSMENYDFFESDFLGVKDDRYTDMIMLNILVSNKNETLKEKAFLSKYGYINDTFTKQMTWNQYNNLLSVLNDEQHFFDDYGRHWNGWQLVLKPLLLVMSYQNVLVFLFIIGIILLGFNCYFIRKKFDFKFLLVFILSLISISFYAFSTCVQFSIIFLLTLIGNLIVLVNIDNKKFNSEVFFFVFGAIVTFFNFLNFTLISLIFPLIILLAYKFYHGEYINYHDNIKFVIKNSLCWFLGYIILWICKWLIGVIVLGGNFIKTAIMSANQRLGIVSTFNFLDILYLNIHEFFKHKSSIIILGFIIITLFVVFRKNGLEKFKISLPLLIISIYPFLWYLVLQNHSAVHFWMTYRLLGTSIFSLLFLVVFLLDKNIDISKVEKLSKDDYLFFILIILFLILYKLKLVYLIILIIFLFMKNVGIEVKKLSVVLVCFCVVMLLLEIVGKKYFVDDGKFKNIYNEIYNHAIEYGNLYVLSNNIADGTKIDIRNLVSEYDSNSVFLLQCKGYVIVNHNSSYLVDPYINCDDVIVTDGYEK